MMIERRPALGKGLSALIPDAAPPAAIQSSIEVDVDQLAPNRDQPRLQMDDARLAELAQSIRVNGVIQPIVVHRVASGYRIIAGERRWRAAQRAGLRTVPVVIREVPEASPQDLLQLALIENIQREDLNCMDEAMAYQRLADEFHMTQEQIASAVGKDRSSIANYLRLLKLPEEVRSDLAAGTLSMGHARALLALPDPHIQRDAAREVIGRQLSVRDTESLVKRTLSPPSQASVKADNGKPDVHTRAAEDRLRFVLGTRVRIVRKGSGGRIEIVFGSEMELNRIYEHITGAN
jgi:ParB family chromosome partitioning protein